MSLVEFNFLKTMSGFTRRPVSLIELDLREITCRLVSRMFFFSCLNKLNNKRLLYFLIEIEEKKKIQFINRKW